MLNLYKTMSRQQGAAASEHHTGHDRFAQSPASEHRPRRRRARPPAARRAHSALELNPRALAVARQSLQRSASTESQPEDDSKPLLNRLFSCVTISSVGNDQQSPNRHVGRYEYTALEAENSVHERLELERKARAQAQSACLHYLRCCPRYSLLHHLNDIGSRVDKQWFVVRDVSVKTERLLTLVPRSSNCPIACDAETRTTILDLFLALQHPYIYPILDLEFQEASTTSSDTYIILVLPFNNKGSLKDLIYQSSWQDDWCEKYSQRTEGLPTSQVQRLGRQILEALLFLKERGFPSCTHLHSGNVILQNGVARLSGLENTLFGFTSRIHPVIWSLAKADPAAIDIICFGHILFEMCAGYELKTQKPSPANYLDIDNYPQVVEVLEFIFQNPKCRFPSIEELLVHDFFRNIDLREMRASSLSQVYHARLTTSAITLLNSVKQFQVKKSKMRRNHSTPAEPPSPPPRGDQRLKEAERLDDQIRQTFLYRCRILESNDYSLECPDPDSCLDLETQV
ncbi:slowpoke-binding protein isoform X2 [Nilaparvata lugens]|uniref:slowpoke-binding protein isoform X2 n=1 Tax=Nilaparvata lugens TaxID=108931 RepID=UPI00193CA052|nr:slowpoke-binding protein isoform X2 [Nilaparvata lugens]